MNSSTGPAGTRSSTKLPSSATVLRRPGLPTNDTRATAGLASVRRPLTVPVRKGVLSKPPHAPTPRASTIITTL
jgi:hypothetical protein